MADKTGISWCDSTWNPLKGCDKVSPACVNCYIVETPPFRIKGLKHGDPIYVEGDNIWNDPIRWNRRPWICDQCGRAHSNATVEGWENTGDQSGIFCVGCNGITTMHRRKVFVLSLSDWLLGRIETQHRARLLNTIRLCPDLIFMLLSKRVEDFFELVEAAQDWHFDHGDRNTAGWLSDWRKGYAPRNVMVGTTVEDNARMSRVRDLVKIPAAYRFLSCEPLLEEPLFHLSQEPGCYTSDWTPKWAQGIHGVIFGGESGNRGDIRPCNIDWIRSGVRQCQAAELDIFVKQLGGRAVRGIHDARGKYCGFQGLGLKHPKGGDITEWPEDLRIQDDFQIQLP